MGRGKEKGREVKRLGGSQEGEEKRKKKRKIRGTETGRGEFQE